jgi:hypothetical protein
VGVQGLAHQRALVPDRRYHRPAGDVHGLELPYWWTIQSIAYGVVLWTLLVQAGSMALVLRWLRP